MNTQNQNIIPGLGQIAQEEAQLAYGIQRVFLALVSIGLFIGSLYVFSNPDMADKMIKGFISQGIFCKR